MALRRLGPQDGIVLSAHTVLGAHTLLRQAYIRGQLPHTGSATLTAFLAQRRSRSLPRTQTTQSLRC